jgi:hypothetical protein
LYTALLRDVRRLVETPPHRLLYGICRLKFSRK